MTTVILAKDGNGQIMIRFNYHPELMMKIKKIKGRNWHPDAKYGIVPNIEPTLELLSSIFRN